MKNSDQQRMNTAATPVQQVFNACSFLFSKIRIEKMSEAKTTQDDLGGPKAHDHGTASPADHGIGFPDWVLHPWSILIGMVMCSHLPWWLPLTPKGHP
ncbi:hypothetical protein [Aquabacterium sp. NJ1]|uniref:hypothetical protein n=1 Tax=Aquabacterium sp. NJ1 TaxID=1538295 RepID=UPI001269BFF1|nr:hypothetical protein [Aquabacterium sp. NJ1]